MGEKTVARPTRHPGFPGVFSDFWSAKSRFSGVGEMLRITQQELAYLVGLSRQRVNVALNTLEQQGAIRIEYGGMRVLQLPVLRAYGTTS